MTTTTSPEQAGTSPRVRRTGWLAAGVLAGLAGVVGVQASSNITAAYEESIAGDAVAIAQRLAEQRAVILVEHIGFSLAGLAMLVFAAGLARFLAAALDRDSLLPAVAASGLVVTSAICLLGTGLTTELVFGLSEGARMVPEFAVVGAHWLGTVPWLWAAAGVSAIAVAVAALRHGALPRWLGWVSVVLGGLTVAFGVSPLQYMAGFTGPVWLLVCAAGLWFSTRARRS